MAVAIIATAIIGRAGYKPEESAVADPTPHHAVLTAIAASSSAPENVEREGDDAVVDADRLRPGM